MAKILVLGNINIETTVAVDSFPIDYAPVHYLKGGVQQRVSAVGYNVAKALRTLSNEVNLLSIIGKDVAAEQIRHTLKRDDLPDRFLLSLVAETPQSVVLYDKSGRRQVHTDLKDVLEQTYPEKPFYDASADCDALVMTNISYSKPLLASAKQSGKLIVTDVQTISMLDDDYNRPFIQSANILLMSGEKLSHPPQTVIAAQINRQPHQLVIVSMGKNGAMLGVGPDKRIFHVDGVVNQNVISTAGAGDALCASFLHGYLQSGDAYLSLEKAIVFASHKVGFAASSDGFVSNHQLEQLHSEARRKGHITTTVHQLDE